MRIRCPEDIASHTGAAFKAKGHFYGLLDTVSVKVSLNPRTPLLGAIHYFA
ncbi:MAG: hypothetical protein PHU14_16560 [Methylovulum sp.]|nr:hypothetical protein [Methylovulum sp.]